MTDAKYLLRFDDICPTMNWTVWDAIEAQLVRFNVKPILAVIPDNRDLKLMQEPPRADFWDRVREWQARGWTIALHGYQHVYVNKNAGMMRLTKQSEFAGLAREEQKFKLTSALAIFEAQGVRADAWIAPSHSFDRITVEILKELGMPVISDGLWSWPFSEQDRMIWVPQQLWHFRPKPAGVWTVCNHHNSWTSQNVEKFGEELATYAPSMTDLASVVKVHGHRKLTLLDRWTAFYVLMWNHRVRSWLSFIRRRLFATRATSA